MSGFVHLHLHSEYSLLDGACKIKEIPQMVKALGQTAVAITDHGNMFGVVEFFKACKEEGIKPIIGCEVYLAPGSRFERAKVNNLSYYHLVLLAKNEIGYKNLSHLVSAGFTEGFYVKPRIDIELLKAHSEGLIALSACLSGYIPKSIILGDVEGAEEHIRLMMEIFGEDFYLEIQNHGLDEEKTVNDSLIMLAEKFGCELVATNDVHYLKREDAPKQLILMSVQTNSTKSNNSGIAFKTSEFYLKSEDEMRFALREYPEVCDVTVKIAEKCNFEFDFSKIRLPKFPIENTMTSKEYLRRLAYLGFEEKIERALIRFDSEHSKSMYENRIESELAVIDKMGYNDYFLIVWDFINYAKTNSIPVGPGRGSGAGSIVAYLLGITEVDSIKFDLLFERFLNVERISMPDIDTDFCYERRDEVIEYVKSKYGLDHVAQIVTFGTMAARAAIRDVGRVLEIPYAEVDAVSKMIPHNITLAQALEENKELKRLYDTNPQIKELIDTSMSIEGLPRHASTHAAGVVITEDPLSDYLPLAVNGGMVVTQYAKDAVEQLGFLKFDFLALRYLTIISDTEKLIRKKHPDFSVDNLTLDDPDVYKLLSSGRTDGVFQLESAGIKQVLTQLQPSCFDDIIACIALYRPGPMDSIPEYIERRHNPTKIKFKTPLLEPILKSTYGCIVYQEQVMQMCVKIAGYSYGHADIVRRAMSKKKASVMEQERNEFIEGALKNGITEVVANELFEEMLGFAKYAFNKSHAVAYAIIAYRTAYLKCKFPKEYYASLITSVLGNISKTNEYVDECEKLNIRVLPPDVNRSEVNFSVDGANIRFGLLALKNVGRNFISAIVSERNKGGEFTSFESFVFRLKDSDMNKRQIEALIKVGAFDSLGKYRSQLMQIYEEIVDSATNISRTTANGQTDIFSMMSEGASNSVLPQFEYPEIEEFSKKELLMYEKEVSGMFFSGHILDSYSNHIEQIKPVKIIEIVGNEDSEGVFKEKDTVKIAGIITSRTIKQTKKKENMAFITIEDSSGEIEVIVFPKFYESYADVLVTENVVCVTGAVSVREDEPCKILLSNAQILRQNNEIEIPTKKLSPKLYLKVNGINSPIVNEITKLLREFSGDAEIIFYDIQTKKYVKATDISISVNAQIIAILKSILGDDAVIYKEGK